MEIDKIPQRIAVSFFSIFRYLWIGFVIIWCISFFGIAFIFLVTHPSIEFAIILSSIILFLGLGMCSMLAFYNLHLYLKYNKKELYEPLLRDFWHIDFEKFPLFTMNYNSSKLWKYIFDDSRDDKQSLKYKNRYRLLIIMWLISTLIFLFVLAYASRNPIE